MKSIKKARRLAKPLLGVASVGAAAALPGTAEAHCGHGMYGVLTCDLGGYSNWCEDQGCIGKGDTPPDNCEIWMTGGGCYLGELYYNCYFPC
jgi:hypothetical protein